MKNTLIAGVALVGAAFAVPEALAQQGLHGQQGFCWGGDIIGRCMVASNQNDDFWERWNFISCDEALRVLANRGYSSIKTVSCKGMTYVFNARWKGKSYELKVASRNGALRSVRKI